MQYLGGKSRVAKCLIAAMGKAEGRFTDLGCGGLSVSVAAARAGYSEIVCVDSNAALIAMYRAAQSGWEPPPAISEADYAAIRQRGDPADPVTAFAAIAASFGGKWWGGYARCNRGFNYVGAGRRRVMANMDALRSASFVCADMTDYLPEGKGTVYADPPYLGTTEYAFSVDHGRLWRHLRKLGAMGNRVFVSEFSAPCDFRPIWVKSMPIGNLARLGSIDKLHMLEIEE